MREKILVPRLDVIMNAIDVNAINVNAIDGNLRSLEYFPLCKIFNKQESKIRVFDKLNF